MKIIRFLKRIVLAILILCVIFACALLFVNIAIRTAVPLTLERIFPGSKTSLGSGRLIFGEKADGGISVELSDLALAVKDRVNIKAEHVGIVVLPGRLISSVFTVLAIEEIAVSGIRVNADLPGKSLKEFKKDLFAGRVETDEAPRISLERLSIKDAGISFNLKDLKVEAVFSADFKPTAGVLDRISLKADKVQNIPGLELDGMDVRYPVGPSRGAVSAKMAKYDKLTLEGPVCAIRFSGSRARVEDFSAAVMGGTVAGSAEFNLKGNLSYIVDMGFVGIDLDRMSRELKLDKKVSITGKIAGKLHIRGDDEEIMSLAGRFASYGGGGRVTIKDEDVFSGMADRNRMDVDLVVESLKDYQYNKGEAIVRLEKGNIGLNIILEGDTGKRDLDIIFHGN